MRYVQRIFQPDYIGAIASTACLIHCMATPLIFVAKACSVTCCSDAPVWWKAIDYLFLIVSFVAIFYATKDSTKKWIVVALWSSWLLLFVSILSESFNAAIFPASFGYFPALAIVGFHFYNFKYCGCTDNEECLSHA